MKKRKRNKQETTSLGRPQWALHNYIFLLKKGIKTWNTRAIGLQPKFVYCSTKNVEKSGLFSITRKWLIQPDSDI